MLRCVVRQRPLHALSTVGRSRIPPYAARNRPQLRLATTATIHDHGQTQRDTLGQPLRPTQELFGQDVAAWLELLDSRLPVHLRDKDLKTQTPADSAGTSGAEAIVNILCDAGNAKENGARGGRAHDLLGHLGTQQGRWRAVMWLIKSVVEDSPLATASAISNEPRSLWELRAPLHEITRDSIAIELDQMEASTLAPQPLPDDHFDHMSTEAAKVSRHQALARIWLSLGNMILRNEGNIVKPEILEIIAYLHHRGIIPSSIYSQKPRTDVTAIQQPPTLHLLSSRILVALSDAAWRAHEKLVVEEAKAKGGDYAAIRPEIPGSAYRVHVEGISREIWIELVLWSCLHGGWIHAGMRILLNICRSKKPRWKPLAWRTLLKTDTSNFDSIDHLVHTRAAAFEEAGESGQDIRDTISSEVVNAYIDAILSALDSQEPGRRVAHALATKALYVLREFLALSELRLSGGSWNAIITRLAESLRGNEELSPEVMRHFIEFSPGFGAEVTTEGAQGLPSYVLDGNASVLGLAHRALQLQISKGDLEAAMKVLRLLRDFTDSNKHESLRDFFATIRANVNSSPNASSHFTSNYSPIDYPGFNLQIPSTILGPLLELATVAGDIEVGKWLLHDQDLDGPVIPESLYADPAIAPALIRFATRTSDQKLLSKVVNASAGYNAESKTGPTMPENVVQSFLDTQITLRRWEAVDRILEYLRDSHSSTWNAVNLAHLAQTILHMRSEGHSDVAYAINIFRRIIRSRFDAPRHSTVKSPRLGERLMLLTMLATIDARWTAVLPGIAGNLKFLDLDLGARAFNVVLDGVVATQGAEAGRRLLRLFWSQGARRELGEATDALQATQEEGRQFGIELLRNAGRQRTRFTLPGLPQKVVTIQGGVRPDVATIRIIYRGALQELRAQNDTTAASRGHGTTAAGDGNTNTHNRNSIDDMTTWAVRAFWALGASRSVTEHQVGAMITEYGHVTLKDRLPILIEQAGVSPDSDVVVSVVNDEDIESELEGGMDAEYEPLLG